MFSAISVVPPQLQDILSELYTFDNGKYTYYIAPLEKIVHSSHFGDSTGKCLGYVMSLNNIKFSAFTGFVGDPYSNSRIILQFSGGGQCVGHQVRRATLTISCSRELSSPFEIQEVQELGPCETTIIAASPVVCTISPKPKEPKPIEETPDRMQQLIEIEEQLILLRNRVLELVEQLP